MKKGTGKGYDPACGGVLEELFRHAEPRERASSDKERAIRESLHDQWSVMIHRRTMKRRGFMALAASIAVAAVATAVSMSTPEPTIPGRAVAKVELTKGHSSFTPAGGGPGSRVHTSTMLETGQEIRTAPGGGLALRWHNGITLRIDQDSRVRLLSLTSAELLSGRLYVDTDTAEAPNVQLSFNTPAGPVRHEGTRYVVSVRSGTTQLRVRDGRVLLGPGEASGGERLTVSAAGEQTLDAIEPFGESWYWAEQLAVRFETDGRTVVDLLDWVVKETGRTVEYASDEARRLAEITQLHGNVGNEPLNVLKLAMESTDLEADVLNGTIRVFVETSR